MCPLPSSLPHPPSQAWGHPTAPILLTSNSKDSSLHLCTFYRNGVIQYELFCRWLLLLNFMSLEVMHTSSMAAYIHPLVVVHYVTIAWSVCCAAHGHLGNSHMGILSYYGIAVTDIIVPGMSTLLLAARGGVEWLGRRVCLRSAFPKSFSQFTLHQRMGVLLIISSPTLGTARPSNLNAK